MLGSVQSRTTQRFRLQETSAITLNTTDLLFEAVEKAVCDIDVGDADASSEDASQLWLTAEQATSRDKKLPKLQIMGHNFGIPEPRHEVMMDGGLARTRLLQVTVTHACASRLSVHPEVGICQQYARC